MYDTHPVTVLQTTVSNREKGKIERKKEKKGEKKNIYPGGRQGKSRREIGDHGSGKCTLVKGIEHCMTATPS